MRKALGRGLDALISPLKTPGQEPAQNGGSAVLAVPIERIRANHLQPRKFFDPEKLSELAASIKEHGLAQPIVVSHDRLSNTYELIAGERRLRACELAGLSEVEVIVRSPETDKERLAIAMIENLQREDLNPIEEALGYLRLMKEFAINQTELTKVVGKSKSAISNTLRLLELPDEIQKALEYGKLTEGHARALLMVADASQRHKLFALALETKLSVRELEDLARQANSGGGPAAATDIRTSVRPAPRPADLIELESRLQESLSTKVEIKSRKDPAKGSITIHYYSLEDFDRIVGRLKK